MSGLALCWYRNPLVVLWALLAGAVLPARATTYVCGPIIFNTTWDLAGSPYVLTCDVIVMAGATLTIEAGVEVRLQPGTTLVIAGGTLQALGTAGLPTTFVPDDPQNPGTAVQLPAGTPAVANLNWCEFSGHQIGVQAWGGSLTIDGGQFVGNVYGVLGGGANVAVSNAQFDNNTYALSNIGAASTLTGNTITGGSTAVSNAGTQVNNVISGAGIGVDGASELTGNTITGCGTAVRDAGSVTNNTINGNTTGVEGFSELTGNEITGNATGIVITSGNAVIECNDLYGNTDYDAVMQTPATLIADHNWWATLDAAQIEGRIYDRFDDAGVGFLVFEPVLRMPHGQAWRCSCDATVWTQVATTGPSPRLDHAMAYDSARGVTVLFGGLGGSYLYDDTWEWDGTAWTQVAATGPSPRWGHAMAYDSARGVVVLFGGFDGSEYGDTWEWDGTAWTQVATTGPAPRLGHAMAYDSARGVTVLFGGGDSNYNNGLGDTWEWDGTTWTQVATAGPPPRWYCPMAYDSARGATVMFGGYTGAYFGDTWEWNGAMWMQFVTSGPSPRGSHATAYDSARGVTVLFGGERGSGDYGDTWEWSGSRWTQVSDPNQGPGPHWGHAMVYDSARGVTVLFGGYTSAPRGDTWERGVPGPVIDQQPADQNAWPGSMVSLSVVATGSAPLTYQWRKDLVPLSDDGRISGATTPTLTIDPAQPSDAGQYDVIVSVSCGGVASEMATLQVACSGDVDGDGDTDLDDITIMLVNFGCTGGGCTGDLDADGDTDLDDITLLLLDFGCGM